MTDQRKSQFPYVRLHNPRRMGEYEAMERKRDGPVPTGEGFNELNGPEEKALQLAPQARHHFTQARSGEPACRG